MGDWLVKVPSVVAGVCFFTFFYVVSEGHMPEAVQGSDLRKCRQTASITRPCAVPQACQEGREPWL